MTVPWGTACTVPRHMRRRADGQLRSKTHARLRPRPRSSSAHRYRRRDHRPASSASPRAAMARDFPFSSMPTHRPSRPSRLNNEKTALRGHGTACVPGRRVFEAGHGVRAFASRSESGARSNAARGESCGQVLDRITIDRRGMDSRTSAAEPRRRIQETNAYLVTNFFSAANRGPECCAISLPIGYNQKRRTRLGRSAKSRTMVALASYPSHIEIEINIMSMNMYWRQDARAPIQYENSRVKPSALREDVRYRFAFGQPPEWIVDALRAQIEGEENGVISRAAEVRRGRTSRGIALVASKDYSRVRPRLWYLCRLGLIQ
ncbi:hypothetical protein B0H10DRAFT_1087069 [Mycena sp. CBHHK59/15]|nr:hypothetical protein B0H10DRAFT_1087069 [Mycena sp. CBHHK59/15]